MNSPGMTKLITPAHMHISVEVLSSVGMLPSITVGAPGTHGATVAGMQGIGVRTPMAAAVAAATIGFAGDMHMPNGMIFTSRNVVHDVGVRNFVGHDPIGRQNHERTRRHPHGAHHGRSHANLHWHMRPPSQLAAGHSSKAGNRMQLRTRL